MKNPHDLSERGILARTIYGEARGEIWCGKEAVALVILNRAANPGWWGSDVKSVSLCPAQFSCWNTDDANYEIILADTIQQTRQWLDCWHVAELALSSELFDFTQGSTHYHTAAVSPAWARGKTPVVQVGAHLFYNDVE